MFNSNYDISGFLTRFYIVKGFNDLFKGVSSVNHGLKATIFNTISQEFNDFFVIFGNREETSLYSKDFVA